MVNSKMETEAAGRTISRTRRRREFDRSSSWRLSYTWPAINSTRCLKTTGLYSSSTCSQTLSASTQSFSFRMSSGAGLPARTVLISFWIPQRCSVIFDKYVDGRSSTADRGAFLEVLCDVGMMAMVLDRKGKKNILHRRGGMRRRRPWRRRTGGGGA